MAGRLPNDQGKRLAIGAIDEFDWKAVAIAAVTAGITQGVVGDLQIAGLDKIANAAVRAALGSALTQGVLVATGVQKKFSWVAVAGAGIGAAAGTAAGEALGGTALGDALGQHGVKAVEGGVRNLVSSAIGGRDNKGHHLSGRQLALSAFDGALSGGLGSYKAEQDRQAQYNVQSDRILNRKADDLSTNGSHSPRSSRFKSSRHIR